jgi:hypothetical protein
MRGVLATCRLTFVQSSRQLADCLASEQFGLVVIGSAFHFGRVADALQTAVRVNPSCPVLCVVTRPFGPLAEPSSYTAFRSQCLALGAYDALDLTRWRDDAQGNAYLRSLLESVLDTQP